MSVKRTVTDTATGAGRTTLSSGRDGCTTWYRPPFHQLGSPCYGEGPDTCVARKAKVLDAVGTCAAPSGHASYYRRGLGSNCSLLMAA